MPRPPKKKFVKKMPMYTGFKPTGVPARNLDKVVLTVEEFEAIRLADYIGLSHLEASRKMQTARSTFSRILEKARKKVSTMLIMGNELIISGGNVDYTYHLFKCAKCGQLFHLRPEDNQNCPDCSSEEIKPIRKKFRRRNRRSK